MKKILIVEDDPFIAMDLEDIFSDEGYEVLGPIASVEVGLKILQSEQPDIALLDYNLGRETSIPIARALASKEIPFLFLSGQIERVVIGHDLPKTTVIAKPFAPQKIIDFVQSLTT